MSDTPETTLSPTGSSPASPSPISPAPISPAPISPSPAPQTLTECIDIDHFAKVALRVARVISAEPIPKSKKLLKLQIDLGPTLGQRQILSGIALHYSPESLVGRKIVVVANLQPAKLMGHESQGMLLASSTDDGTVLTLVDPGQHLPEGSIVR